MTAVDTRRLVKQLSRAADAALPRDEPPAKSPLPDEPLAAATLDPEQPMLLRGPCHVLDPVNPNGYF